MSFLLVTPYRFRRALRDVQAELSALSLWDRQLASIRVRLVPYGQAYGWQWMRGSGDICIPLLSLCRVRDWLGGPRCSLRDVLRHEYAHAFADTHRGLVHSRLFSDAFGASHDSDAESDFDPAYFMTEYAATDPSEDFAETFMLFVRHRGRLPAWHHTPAIRCKWRFVHRLRAAIRRGHARF